MSKAVRIIALIMAILLGLSALGMIAMYVAAETTDGASVYSALSCTGLENILNFSKAAQITAKIKL